MNKKNQPKTYFNWSSGKDSALALHYLLQKKEHNISKLITTINKKYDRVSMHGLRTDLLKKQATALGIPLQIIEVPEQVDMDSYNLLMKNKVEKLKNEGYSHCAFGDIFLEDLRTYREQQFEPFNIKCEFPIWKKNTSKLIEEFIAFGFKAVVVCTKASLLDESFVGRELNLNFINDLPKNVDPCGENGEFHTFCYDGPIFKEPIPFKIGEKVYREYKAPKNENQNPEMGFWFCDIY